MEKNTLLENSPLLKELKVYTFHMYLVITVCRNTNEDLYGLIRSIAWGWELEGYSKLPVKATPLERLLS